MRRFIATNAQLFQRLETIEYHQLEMKQHQDLIRKAKQSIVLIDNYVDDTVLTLLDKRAERVSATIYTQRINNQF